jgi:hypothetical protein
VTHLFTGDISLFPVTNHHHPAPSDGFWLFLQPILVWLSNQDQNGKDATEHSTIHSTDHMPHNTHQRALRHEGLNTYQPC